MATESPLIHDGAQCVLSTAIDYRRSSITGTTLNGPNGSGQFYAVSLSTVAAAGRTIIGASTAASGGKVYGILQNTPGPGEVADVGIFGVTKMIAGSTAITGGIDLMAASTVQGRVIPYSSAAGQQRLGVSIEPATALGQVFTALVYGGGMGGGSIA